MSAEKQEIARDDVADDIAAAMDEIANKEPENETDNQEPELVEIKDGPAEEKPERARDETGKFAKAQKEKEQKQEEKQAKPEASQTQEIQKTELAPQSWGANVKAQWASLPADVRAEISRREADFHKMLTRNDGELSLGREMKDVMTPYMPIIQAQGVTPKQVVSDLLNTAYKLGSGDMSVKVATIQEIARNYGVDLGQVQQQPPVDPVIQGLQQELHGLKQTITQQMTLQQQQAHDSVLAEVQSFAADPRNVHFAAVENSLAPLLADLKAQNPSKSTTEIMQEAYDRACWANPEIRSILLQNQKAEEAEKRNQEIAKKKAASVSVTGSPGVNAPSSTPNNNTVEDDIRAAMNDLLDT